MASILLLCHRCSARVRFTVAPPEGTPIFCEACLADLDQNARQAELAAEAVEKAAATAKAQVAAKAKAKAQAKSAKAQAKAEAEAKVKAAEKAELEARAKAEAEAKARQSESARRGSVQRR